MTRQQYGSLPITELKAIAKTRGMKGLSAAKKGDIIEAMLTKDAQDAEKAQAAERPQTPAREREPEERKGQEAGRQHTGTEGTLAGKERPGMDMASLDSGVEAHGIVEVLQDGYGFIRSANYLPGENDIYVNPSMIRKFNLKTGDILRGNVKVRNQGEKFAALLYIKSINGYKPDEAARRRI